MIDENTPNLNLPLPAAANPLSEDVNRLRAAIGALDSAVVGKAPTVHGHEIEDIAGLAAALLAKVEAAALAAVAFSGAYADLTGTPPVFSGSYNDLADKPTLFSGAYADLTGQPTLFSGVYADLTGKPALFSGAYADLTGKPSIPTAVSQLTNDAGFITSSALTGYLLSSTAASTYLTQSAAASTYQTQAGMSAYLTTTAAASTYQTQAGMASYLTTSAASTTYAPKASPAFTGVADFQGAVQSSVVAVAASAINCASGNFFTKTATGALTWTVTNVPASRAYSFILELTNGGTGTQTWFSGIKWPGGTAPTLAASGVDVLGFITDDGGATWRGVQLMKDSK